MRGGPGRLSGAIRGLRHDPATGLPFWLVRMVSTRFCGGDDLRDVLVGLSDEHFAHGCLVFCVATHLTPPLAQESYASLAVQPMSPAIGATFMSALIRPPGRRARTTCSVALRAH